MPLSNLQTRAVETLVHPYTNQATFRETGPLVFERGKGVYIYDTEGKQYLEGMAGLWCTALGYDNEELVEAAAAQMRKLPFAHLFTAKSHDPGIEPGIAPYWPDPGSAEIRAGSIAWCAPLITARIDAVWPCMGANIASSAIRCGRRISARLARSRTGRRP